MMTRFMIPVFSSFQQLLQPFTALKSVHGGIAMPQSGVAGRFLRCLLSLEASIDTPIEPLLTPESGRAVRG